MSVATFYGSLEVDSSVRTVSALSGSLDLITFPSLVQFLTSLLKTGTLRVSQGAWAGEVGFDHGQVVAATLGTERGLAALDAIALVLREGQFTFTDSVLPDEHNLGISPDQLQAHLDTLVIEKARLAAILTSLGPDAVPEVIKPLEGAATAHAVDARGIEPEAQVTLDRPTLRTLLAVDGRRTVAEIAAERGLLQTTLGLARLMKVGVIQVTAPAARTGDHGRPSKAPVARSHIVGMALSPDVRPVEPEPAAAATPSNLLPALPETLPTPAPQPSRPSIPAVHAGEPAEPAALPPAPLAPWRKFSLSPLAHGSSTGADRGQGTTQMMDEAHRAVGVPMSASSDGAGQGGSAPEQQVNGRATHLMSPPVHWQPESTEPPAAQNPGRNPNITAGEEEAWQLAPVRAAAQRPQPTPEDDGGSPASRGQVAAPVREGAVTRLCRGTAGRLRSSVPGLVLGPVAMGAAAVIVLILLLFRLKDGGSASGAPRARLAALLTAADDAGAGVPSFVASAPGGKSTELPVRTVLDERFGTNQRNWPNDPQSTAWLAADGTYHLLARQPGQFVAVAAPGVGALSDVAITASFHKVGGPAGGGYGVILRDQGPEPRDGRNQGGRYYVFVVGDRGEVGIWRREDDHWVDILPWTPSVAVRPGNQPNQLDVLAVGPQLTFRVNGTKVASRSDATLDEGMVGLFAGGDGNEAAADWFAVITPT